jgi:uncharacterized membrane protein
MEAAHGLIVRLFVALRQASKSSRRSFFMSKSRFTIRQLTTAAIIAAVYTALTTLLPIPQYGAVQLRVAEAMTVLPFFFPEAVVGLTVGCFLSNLLLSPIPMDWIFGTAATLLAALWTRRMPNKYLAPLPPVICNAVIVGGEIALFFSEGSAFWPAFAFNAFTVGLGEAIACFVLGLLLLQVLPRVPSLRPYLHQA